ncbi:MAG: 4Fe-4S dicluster domain-containing protein [Promethearchaeota archaeon]
MPMNQKILLFDSTKCVGCRYCEQWCSFSHFEVTNPSKACIHIERDNVTQEDLAKYCHQCTSAPCIASCEFNALTRDEKTDAIIVIKENCTGCQMCIQECPYGAPIMHPEENFVLICDLCGGEPECVKHCPEDAIIYSEIKNKDRKGEKSNA